MSDKIVTLISSQDKKPEAKKPEQRAPNADLVQMAEEILARAKSGELAAIAVAEVLWSESGSTTTNGSFLYVSGTSFPMIYALERLVYRIKEKSFS